MDMCFLDRAMELFQKSGVHRNNMQVRCQLGMPDCWEALALYDRVIAVGDLVSDGPAIAAKLILDSIHRLYQTDISDWYNIRLIYQTWSNWYRTYDFLESRYVHLQRTLLVPFISVLGQSLGHGQWLRREPLTNEPIILTLRRPQQIYAHLFKPGSCASQLWWLRMMAMYCNILWLSGQSQSQLQNESLDHENKIIRYNKI